MKKDEIITRVLEETRLAEHDQIWNGNEASYSAYVSKALARRLQDIPPEIEIITCEELQHLGIQCCPVCHGEYPDEEQLAELESGALAWLCCAVMRGLNATALDFK